jgi:hypothetical protein
VGGHGYTRRGRWRNWARTIGGCASVGTLAVLVEELSVGWGAGAFSSLFSLWHGPSISVIFLVFFMDLRDGQGNMGVILGDMDLEGNVRGMRGRRKGRTRICTNIPFAMMTARDKSSYKY